MSTKITNVSSKNTDMTLKILMFHQKLIMCSMSSQHLDQNNQNLKVNVEALLFVLVRVFHHI